MGVGAGYWVGAGVVNWGFGNGGVKMRWDGRGSIPGQASLVWMGVMSAMLGEEEVWWMVLLTLEA